VRQQLGAPLEEGWMYRPRRVAGEHSVRGRTDCVAFTSRTIA
jgi:hypothetical protein